MQASDLRKLLEMYAGWQEKILPHVSFDDFIDEMESMGKSYVLKVELFQLFLQTGLHLCCASVLTSLTPVINFMWTARDRAVPAMWVITCLTLHSVRCR